MHIRQEEKQSTCKIIKHRCSSCLLKSVGILDTSNIDFRLNPPPPSDPNAPLYLPLVSIATNQ